MIRCGSGGVAAFLLFACLANAQSDGTQSGGVADVALQGYYVGGNQQGFSSLSGASVSFRDFFPKIGLISGNLEGYEQNTQGRIGENFLQLKGYIWKGRRWTFTGGDFRMTPSLVPFPFLNYFTPLVGIRGAQVEMTEGARTYNFFWGEETLSGGPRITFRIQAPQQVLGGSVRQNLGRLQLGVRYLHLSSAADAPLRFPNYFPAGREFKSTDSLTFNAHYGLTPHLQIYSDATLSRVGFAPGFATPGAVPLSWLSGLVWDNTKLVIRANYGSQSTSYLPVLGYYAGDRRGPYGEVRYKASRFLEVYTSSSKTRNNLENNIVVPTQTATNVSGGATVLLPGQFNVAGQFSQIDLLTTQPVRAGADQRFKNKEYSVTLAKSIAKQNLRVALRELTVTSTQYNQKQTSAELEDTVLFSHFIGGGAVRFQQSNTGQLQNSVFFRGTMQARFGRVTAYGQAEFGNDLVNKTVFATNTVNTTVAGITVRGFKGWTMQAEAFRNSLTAALNPANIFVLATQGQGVSSVLTDVNQWTAYIRMTRRFQWGGVLPEATDQFTFEQIPLVGTVEGFVRETASNGETGVAEIPVVLDGANRKTLTDVSGRYRFDDVAAGPHRLEIGLSELPAEFAVGEHGRVDAIVRERKVSRADLNVTRLDGQLAGVVVVNKAAATNKFGSPADPEEVDLGGIALILTPGDHVTTCDERGRFAFFNLGAGEYRISVDASTLPENYVVVPPGEAKVTISHDSPGSATFTIEKHEPQLPIRKVFGGQAASLQ